MSADSNPKAFEVHVSKAKTLGLVFLAALMTAAAVFCTQRPSVKAQLAGWVGTPFFGFGFLYLIWQMGRMEPVLVIDAAGIDYRTLGVGVVPWDEVVEVSVGQMNRQKFLCVTLVEETPYRAKLSWHRGALAAANRALGFPLLTIPFTGTNRTLEEALDAVRRFRR